MVQLSEDNDILDELLRRQILLVSLTEIEGPNTTRVG